MLWMLVVLAAAPLWGQNSISISCPGTAAAGSTVNCSMGLSLGASVNIDNLTFGIVASGSAAVTANLGFNPSIPNAFVFGAPGTVSAVWAGLSPALTGNVGLGTVTVPLPAVSGNTYTVSITGASASLGNNAVTLNIGGPATVTVTGPVLNVPATSLSFSGTQGGANPAGQSISISNSGSGTLSWTAGAAVTTPSGGTWLSVSPASGTNSGSVTASVNLAGLTAGSYSGTVTISATGAGGSPKVVNVSLTVNPPPPTINRTPSSLSFTAIRLGPNPVDQTINISNSGGGALSWTAASSVTTPSGGTWLTGSGSGTNSGSVTVSVNIAGLASGSYSGTVTITAAGATNTPQTVPVTLTITEPPIIGLSATSLTFNATPTANPPNQTVTISNAGGGTLSWTATGAVISPGGGTWLGVTPASGTNSGTVAVSVNTSGLTAGTYSGTVTVTAAGASNSPQTVGVTLTIQNPPSIAVSPASLSFSGQRLGPNPATQTIAVSNGAPAPAASLNWTAAVATSSGGSWLQVSPASGTNSGALTVSINLAVVGAGTYDGTITVIATGAPNSPKTVPVTLTVSPALPKIGLSTPVMVFSTLPGISTGNQALNISNQGDGTLTWTAAATTGSGGAWLTINPAGGTNSGAITVSVNAANLPSGSFQAAITVTAAGSSNSPQTVQVSLNVGQPPSVAVSTAALSFTATVGGSPPASQTVSVTNTGGGDLFVTASSITSSGGNWLSVTPSSGFAPLTLTANVNTAGLAAGTYQGEIGVTSQSGGAGKSIAVTLRLVQPVSISLTPATLTFSGPQGGVNPATQTITIANSGGGALTWTASATTTICGNWLSVNPASGLEAGTVAVSVSLVGVTAGTCNGNIQIAAIGAANTPQNVPVTLTVTSVNQPILTLAATILQFRSEVNGSSQSATVAITNTGGGTLSFSTAATTESGGNWLSVSASATSAPANLGITVNPSGLAAGGYRGRVAITASGAANSPATMVVELAVAAPQINRGGLCNGASFACDVTITLGSGSIASMFGKNLASDTASATALPLPTTLAGTQVVVNGNPVPLFYVSPTQINLQIPPNLEGTTVTIQVRSGNITSVNTTLAIALAAPGIFTVDSSGKGQGAILNEDFGLNAPGRAAAPGSLILIYATGLGALTPPLAAGQPGGTNPLNLCVNTAVVTIGGQNAEVLFCGAAPGFVGLYQINARIPAATTPGDAVTVQIKIGTAESNIVTASVQRAEILFFGQAPGWPGLDQMNVRVPAGVAPEPAVTVP